MAAPRATYTITSPPEPALTPPPGVVPDFQDPFTLQPYVELTIAFGIAITTVLIAARIFVKTRLTKKWLWEDFTFYVSLEWRAGARIGGGGRHQWNITLDQLKNNLWLSNYSDMLYCISIACVKLSILLLITRIFLAVQRNFLFWATQLLMWVNTLFYAIAFFLAIFGCRPRRKIWSPEIEGKCFDSKALYIVSATFNTGSDVAMLSVLIHMVWKLQMSTRRKMGISAIFGTGVFVVRIFFEIKLTKTKDFTYVHMETGLLGYAEVACGIICACLPLLPLFWHHLSRSTAGGTVALGKMNRSPRHGHNHYDPPSGADAHDPIKGKSWVKLEDGTLTTLPKAHQMEREGSDEQALTGAIMGVK
ncbi:MAG: hypothetical protein Q9219_007128 [cf. Caloplaca sp. 3 TL-2023]